MSPASGRSVLVTGADGFTGRYLADALAAHGHEVHALVRRELDAADPLGRTCAGNVHVCDIMDAAALRTLVASVAPRRVVHLAAVAHVVHEDVDALYRTNIVGSRNLLQALAAAPAAPTLVLLASSANVYGNSTGGVLHEGVPPAPSNDYAISKYAMELMARTFERRLPIQVVRPFNYTGVGQSEAYLLPKIVGHFRRREAVLELGNIQVERDFSDVRTVVDCYRRLLELDHVGPVLNVCSGQGWSLQQILDVTESLCGWRPEVRINPAFVRQNDVHRLIGSKAALEAVIGPIGGPTLAETLSWMIST